MQRKEFFIGIDVSKETLDVAIQGTLHHIRIPNGSEGFKQLLAWFKALGIDVSRCWFVLEYTGGYEYRIIQFCVSKNITFTRVPGLEIKKSMGMQRGKNDKIDSKRIAEYGYEKREKIQPDTPQSASILRIKQLLTQRDGFINDKKANEHRVKELLVMMDFKENDPLIKNYYLAVDFAQKMIDKTEHALNEIIEKEDGLKTTFRLLTSIPGIGPVNAWTTIAFTENFKRFSDARKYGSYCGVVPFDHTSGKSIKKKSRVNHMANKDAKAKLDMAAKASIMYDPEMNAYYQRRKILGKHHMSIMNEVKFKLILRMFAVVNKQEIFVEKPKIAA
ncbi:MAG: IS110 family transposase [Chitinophagales bacterium]